MALQPLLPSAIPYRRICRPNHGDTTPRRRTPVVPPCCPCMYDADPMTPHPGQQGRWWFILRITHIEPVPELTRPPVTNSVAISLVPRTYRSRRRRPPCRMRSRASAGPTAPCLGAPLIPGGEGALSQREGPARQVHAGGVEHEAPEGEQDAIWRWGGQGKMRYHPSARLFYSPMVFSALGPPRCSTVPRRYSSRNRGLWRHGQKTGSSAQRSSTGR